MREYLENIKKGGGVGIMLLSDLFTDHLTLTKTNS